MGQSKRLEAGGDPLTTTEIPSQIPINLEEVEKYVVGDKLTRKDMENMWSNEELLGWYKRYILVYNHRLNHCSFKYLLKISKRGIIPRKLRKIRKLPPCVAFIFGNPHKRPWSTKGK